MVPSQVQTCVHSFGSTVTHLAAVGTMRYFNRQMGDDNMPDIAERLTRSTGMAADNLGQTCHVFEACMQHAFIQSSNRMHVLSGL